MPRNWEHREKKLEKRTRGHRTSNRGIFTVQENQRKRAEAKKQELIRKYGSDYVR